ncbi:MAG: acetyl-CoA acetyltransferase, partial [Actinomycetota bacterium]|nr:acetyl-CoA acetyltransferase [Actinomycetota bacterium]
ALGREPATVTGGMTFAGGPLNSYALHGLATMVGVLRGAPGSRGLVTSVSGFLTKYGGSTWSTTPPPSPWTAADVTMAAAERCGAHHDEAEQLPGPAVVVARTVEHARNGSTRSVSILEGATGVRTVEIDR